MADIKKIIEQQRKAGASNTQDNDSFGFDANSTKSAAFSEPSRIALGALKEIFSGIEGDSIKGLRSRLDSLTRLEGFIKSSNVGSEEEEPLFNAIKSVKTTITNYLTQKKAVLSKATNSVKNSSSNYGSLLINMSKNDPLMKMAVATGSMVAKKIQEKRNRSDAEARAAAEQKRQEQFLKSMSANSSGVDNMIQNSGGLIDLEEMRQKEQAAKQKVKDDEKQKKDQEKQTAKQTEQQRKSEERQKKEEEKQKAKEEDKKKKEEEKQKEREEKEKARKDAPSTPRKRKPSGGPTPGFVPDGGGGGGVSPEFLAKQGELLEKVQASVESINTNVLQLAQDTSQLLQLASLNEARAKNREFDILEAQSEGLKTSAGVGGTTGTTEKFDSKGSSIKDFLFGALGRMFPNFMGFVATMGPAAALGAAILFPVLQGLGGIFKAEEWGVSKISGFLSGMLAGPFTNQLVNVFANMGTWALMGATLGAPFFGVGAIAGGIIGAAVGGIIAFFGGQGRLGKLFDQLGGIMKNAFDVIVQWGTDLYTWISNSASEMWSFLSAAVDPGIEMAKSALTWVGEQISYIFDPIQKTITQVVDWFKNISEKFWGWLDSMTPDWAKDAAGAAKDLGGAVSGAASSAWDATKGMASSAASSISSFFGPSSAEASMGPGASSLAQAPTPPSTPGPTPGISQAPGAKGMQQKVMQELSAAGISDPTAQANIMAQIQRESGFATKSEVMKYSPERLLRVFPKYFKNIQQAQAVVAQGPEAIANVVYGGRMGNGKNEGHKYRGRGLIQLTGKDNYSRYGKMIGVDLVSNPDLANDPDVASKLAVAYFKDKQNHGKNLSDINQVNKSVGFADASGSEGATRRQLAAQFSQQIQAGQFQSVPAANQGNRDIVAYKSAPPPQQPIVINNNASNVNNVKSGGGSGPTPPQASNGTSARRMSYSAAIGK